MQIFRRRVKMKKLVFLMVSFVLVVGFVYSEPTMLKRNDNVLL
jgi:hypothetical protein